MSRGIRSNGFFFKNYFHPTFEEIVVTVAYRSLAIFFLFTTVHTFVVISVKILFSSTTIATTQFDKTKSLRQLILILYFRNCYVQLIWLETSIHL